jgi:hypothetical protein
MLQLKQQAKGHRLQLHTLATDLLQAYSSMNAKQSAPSTYDNKVYNRVQLPDL